MQTIFLKGRGDFEEWRAAARLLLLNDIAPGEIAWRIAGKGDALAGFAEPQQLSLPAEKRVVTVPPAFVELAETAVCHSDPQRFDLLYRLLWRIRGDRHLMQVVSDPDVMAARRLEKSVRRDSHKMKAFVRFKEVASGDPTGRRRSFLAWFEPDHFIVARLAPFFRRRFFDMDWVIATPKGSAAWDGEQLTINDEPAAKPDIRDDADDLWRIYYANIFNPARLKVKAMTSEMPRKYWKNLPEADLIPDLIANAEAKVRQMAEKAASQPPAFHARLRARHGQAETLEAPPSGSWEALREEARRCTRCPLHCHATQTVFGEGPQDARVMLVGEQPGDQEDLSGRPFVGPAGKLFDGVLSDIGVERAGLYVTNAVKHFKYEPRGKRRIHRKPNEAEIAQCRWWLKQEVDLIRPSLIVAMGATAYFSLTGERRRLSEVRGQVLNMTEGRRLLVTVHPSYLLRLPDPVAQQRERELFRDDLTAIIQ